MHFTICHSVPSTTTTTTPRTARARRGAPADADTLYRAEIAAAALLTAEEEQALGRSIVSAERAVLEALVRTPAGAAALRALGRDLEEGRVDLRAVVLNPDEEGLDRSATTKRVAAALLSATTTDERERASIVDTLAAVRLDLSALDVVIAAVRAAGDAAAVAIIDEAQTRLRAAKDRLVIANLRLVLRFARKYQNHGIALLDLVQEGNVGLMRAVDKFDFRRGFRFNTYAAFWIKQALQRALVHRTVRLPIHLAEERSRIARVRARFTGQHHREPTTDEIAKLTGLAPGRVQVILELPAQPVSLDLPVGDDGDARLVDLVAGDTMPVDEAVAASALGEDLDDLLAGLSDRELRVLRMRFGMQSEREHTLDEVGRELSLTRERIRQIERAALQKLRALSKNRDLESYLGP